MRSIALISSACPSCVERHSLRRVQPRRYQTLMLGGPARSKRRSELKTGSTARVPQ